MASKLIESAIAKVKNYFNPESNQGNNFWSAKPAQAFANTQRAVQKVSPKIQQFGQNIMQKTTPDFNNFSLKTVAKAPFQMAGQLVGGTISDIGTVGKYMSDPNAFRQLPNITGESFLDINKPSKASVGFTGLSLIPVGAVKGAFNAQVMKKLLPEIRGVRNLLGKLDEIPEISIAQQDAIRETVKKVAGGRYTKELSKLEGANGQEYFNFVRGLLDDAEYSALNPRLSVGLSTKARERLQSTKGVESMPVKKGKLRINPEKLAPQPETIPQAEAIRKVTLQTKGVESMLAPDFTTVGEVLRGRTPLQVADSSKQRLKLKVKSIEQASENLPKLGDDLKGGGQVPPSEGIISDPIAKITEALRGAKPLRAEQEAIYRGIRSKQAGALAGVGEQMGGETGYFRKLGQLKGEMPKVDFESVRKQIKQDDIDYLFNTIEKSNLPVFQKINAQTGLAKILGAEGGKVPTERELELLSEVFPKDFIEAVLQNKSLWQKLMSGISGALNIPRAIMATADLSAPLRQGIFLIGRPKQWVPAFKEMFGYAFSKRAYDGFIDGVKKDSLYPKMREAGLTLTDTGPSLLKREEAFMSTLPEKVPIFGKIAAGSNRAYSGFLNKLRVDVFKDLFTKAESQGIKMDGKTLRDLGSFINSATGRGNLPKEIERVAPMLNAVFFSPRLMASRVGLLNPVTYIKYDPFVRKEALKSLITFGGTAMTILGLASLGGAEVKTDPRNADFGKIKVGNTRYDILGGFQQYIRLGAQLVTGKIVSSTTGKTITLGEGYKPLTRKDILLRFFENKTSPIASLVVSLLTGQNSIGEPINLSTELINRFIPMVSQDMYDLYKEWGPKGLLMGIPGVFGVGSQTYGKSELVYGENKVGQPTSQIRPVQGMAETISEKVFGKEPLGSSSTWNVQTYVDNLKKLPQDQQRVILGKINETNPDLYDKIKEVVKKETLGITVEDEVLKAKGVASGDRAIAIKKELDKLKTDEERTKLWAEYKKKGIITIDVEKQLKALFNKKGEKTSFMEVKAAEDETQVSDKSLQDLLSMTGDEKKYLLDAFKESNDKYAILGDRIYYKTETGTSSVKADFTVEKPKLTGEKVIDDELWSDYKGEITKTKNAVMKAFELGVIDQKKAIEELSKLKAMSKGTKKSKKLKVKKPKFVKLKIGKSKKIKSISKKKKLKLVRAKKLKTIKL